MPTLLLKNVLGQSPADPGYLAQLEALKEAIRNGHKPHVYMLHSDGSEYFTDLVACRMMKDRINGVLPVRPFIDAEANACASNGIFGGSIDTLGKYIYAPFLWGSDTLKKSSKSADFLPVATHEFSISWFVD